MVIFFLIAVIIILGSWLAMVYVDINRAKDRRRSATDAAREELEGRLIKIDKVENSFAKYNLSKNALVLTCRNNITSNSNELVDYLEQWISTRGHVTPPTGEVEKWIDGYVMACINYHDNKEDAQLDVDMAVEYFRITYFILPNWIDRRIEDIFADYKNIKGGLKK